MKKAIFLGATILAIGIVIFLVFSQDNIQPASNMSNDSNYVTLEEAVSLINEFIEKDKGNTYEVINKKFIIKVQDLRDITSVEILEKMNVQVFELLGDSWLFFIKNRQVVLNPKISSYCVVDLNSNNIPELIYLDIIELVGYGIGYLPIVGILTEDNSDVFNSFPIFLSIHSSHKLKKLSDTNIVIESENPKQIYIKNINEKEELIVEDISQDKIPQTQKD